MSLERARQSVARLRELAHGPPGAVDPLAHQRASLAGDPALAPQRASLAGDPALAPQRASLAGDPALPPGLDREVALDLFESQLLCRLIDVASHELRARGQGHYTICSAGHEGNVALGRLTRTTDPALLHYRSGALFIERARQVASVDPVRHLLLSLVASSDDPISGGRHKVFGSVPLGIPPQTSTIASHLPRAVGLAASLGVAARLDARSQGEPPDQPRDRIVVCSFGDASVNHSTSQGALNAAAWMAFQHLPVPILFVCEDNGLGISVRTPPGWVEARLRAIPGFAYFAADGSDLLSTFEVTRAAVESCRARRAPAFLHLACQRLWGHAGSDIDTEYRTSAEIAAAEEKDPVLCTACRLLEAGVLDGPALAARIEAAERRVRAASEDAVGRPRLKTRAAIMEPIAPSRPDLVRAEATRVSAAPRTDDRPRPMGLTIRAALHELCAKYPRMVVFGEDVAQKGGVYGVTVGLQRAFGPARVWNTLLDEQTILGVALGAGMAGLLPVAEIQFLAYLHNAEDQLRGEAATQSFFSNGQIRNPMVVRIPGLGYQKGFGGHFHNDDSLAVLRDIPGIVVGVPSRGDDAARMLRTLVAAAHVDGRVCVFVEPIALYPVRDLYVEGDGKWCFPMPAEGEVIDVGEVGVYGGDDRSLAIVSYGNGVPMSLRARRRLALEGIAARVVDLRWIAPLPEQEIRRHARETGRVLVVDECRRSGNVSEAIAACLMEDPSMREVRFARVTAADSFVPLGDAAKLVLPTEEEVVHAARRLVQPGAVG